MKDKKIIDEYRKWYNLYLRQIRENTDTNERKACRVKICYEELLGMLLLLWGAKEITEEEYKKLKEELDSEFSTEKQYGFGSYMRAVVFKC